MNLLYLTLDSPLPADNGMRQRTWMLLECLQRLGCRTTLVALAEIGAGCRERLQAAVGEVHSAPGRASSLAVAASRLAALPAAWPASAWRYRSRTARRLIARLLANRAFDAVLADTVFAPVNLPRRHPPLIVNHPDVEHRILARYAACAPRPWLRAYARCEAAKLRRWEAAVARRARLSLACSEEDARVLRQLAIPASLVAVVPNGVDESYWQPPRRAPEPDCIAFTGALDWFPNRDAVQFFAARILPRLRALVPAAKFLVVGRRPPREFVRRICQTPGVEFSGSVDDVRPWLARAAVFAAPLRIGSGTRLKLLQAGCLGMAMVSTRLGAEGLAFEPEREILLADDPDAFAQAIARLLADAGLRQRLGSAARRHAIERYGYAACRTQLENALRALLPQTAPLASRSRSVTAFEEAGA